MVSIAIIFVSLSGYGNLQNSIIDKAHITSYLQDSIKAMYYLDASTLSTFSCRDEPYYCNQPDECRIDSSKCNMGCEELETWTGISVAELLKRDLRDYDGTVGTGLDDKYGPAPAPGKLAARCAFMKILEPFSSGGYTYIVDFKKVKGTTNQVPQTGKWITNNVEVTSCDTEMGQNKLVVNAPFRVFVSKETEADNYIISICVWSTRNVKT
jgi:hypothetical protein